MPSKDEISQIKKCVTFVYLKSEKSRLEPQGTAFFVRAKVEEGSSREFIYLARAKHVIMDCKSKTSSLNASVFSRFFLLIFHFASGSN
jgi:hypothetical protein